MKLVCGEFLSSKKLNVKIIFTVAYIYYDSKKEIKKRISDEGDAFLQELQ